MDMCAPHKHTWKHKKRLYCYCYCLLRTDDEVLRVLRAHVIHMSVENFAENRTWDHLSQKWKSKNIKQQTEEEIKENNMCLRLVRRVAIQSTREEELKSSGIRIYASLTSLYQPIAATDDESHSSNDTRARQTKSIFFYVPCLFQSDKMLFFFHLFLANTWNSWGFFFRRIGNTRQRLVIMNSTPFLLFSVVFAAQHSFHGMQH